MKKILIIDTGGTISQEPDDSGVLKPSASNYIDKIPRLGELAQLELAPMKRIDSTIMSTEYRGEIATMIYRRHHEFDGFVVLHGTDTMADTACALTYMLQNLGKPVVVTGAQLPIFSPGPDGINNLYYSVEAATGDLGEVVICFGDRIIRGSRAVKENTHGFNAFSSPRLSPIGELGVTLRLLDHKISRFRGNPVLFTHFDPKILYIPQTSGSTIDILKPLLKEEISGLVIGGFGTGNIMSHLIPSIKAFIEKDVPVVVTTICHKGSTMLSHYSVGQAAAEAGAIEGGDLSAQAAVQKLMYACGRVEKEFPLLSPGDKHEFVKSLFTTPVSRDLA